MILADFLVILGHDCLGKLLCAKMVIEVVGQMVVGEAVEVALTQVGNVVGGGGGVSVVEVDNAVRMSVGDGGAGNRRNGVVNGEGDVGMGVGGAKQRDCCRFRKIFVKLWEDSRYSLPF